MIHHYKPEYHVRKMGCYLQVKFTVTEFGFMVWLGLFNEIMTISITCSELLIFWRPTNLTVHAHKLECLVKRLLCCIQGQGHIEVSELQ